MSEYDGELVCNLAAIPADERQTHQANTQALIASAQQIMELPDGYALQLPDTPNVLMQAAAYIANERLCCPFFHFALEVEPHGGAVWLKLTGSPDVKAFLRAQLAGDAAST